MAKFDAGRVTPGNHYLSNANLLQAVIEAKELNRVTDKLAQMLMLLTQRYSRKSNFIGYSFREDMVSTALVNLCHNALKFNPEKSSNPFAFYTTAIHHSFLQYMNDEKKHRNIRDALLVDMGSNPSFVYMESNKDAHGEHAAENITEIRHEITAAGDRIAAQKVADAEKARLIKVAQDEADALVLAQEEDLAIEETINDD